MQKDLRHQNMAVKEVSQSLPPSSQSEPAMSPQVFYYSPLRFLQTMLAIAWAAFAHPFSSTVIDLTTCEARHETGEDGA
jgi:hypothetical protein